jgi:hypothetical protein
VQVFSGSEPIKQQFRSLPRGAIKIIIAILSRQHKKLPRSHKSPFVAQIGQPYARYLDDPVSRKLPHTARACVASFEEIDKSRLSVCARRIGKSLGWLTWELSANKLDPTWLIAILR